MDVVESLARGRLDAASSSSLQWPNGPSPWALALALVPETAPWDAWLPVVREAAPQPEIAIDPAVSAYVAQKVAQWGLDASSMSFSEFLRFRIRLQDSYFRNIVWDPAEDDKWYTSVVCTLQRLRQSGYSNWTLEDFEAADYATVLDALSAVGGPSLVHELGVPYLRFHGRLNDASHLILNRNQSLQNISLFSDVPELADAVRNRCLDASPEDSRLVGTLAPDLKDAARAARVLGVSPRQIIEWKGAESATQLDVLIRFLRDTATSWKTMATDLNTLRKYGVFKELSVEDIDREVVRSALAGSKFMFLQTQLGTFSPGVLHEQVMALVDRAVTTGGVDLRKSRMALDLLGREHGGDPAVAALSDRVETLRRVQDLGVAPSAVSKVKFNALDVTRLALQSGAPGKTRPRLEALVDIAHRLDCHVKRSAVVEQCIEAALSDNDFTVAAELCQQLPPDADNAWLAWLQVGKYLAPQWDSPRPLPVLEVQQHLLGQCLAVCPAADLSGVLRAWQTLEQEVALATNDDDHVESGDIFEESRRSSTPILEPSGPVQERSGTPRLQNLLVSGIGWAIGAPRD